MRELRKALIFEALVSAGLDRETLTLAMRRYQDDEPQDAYRMFCNDRARAGLGALARRPRKGDYHPHRGVEHHRRKGLDHEGRVMYWMRAEARFFEDVTDTPLRLASLVTPAMTMRHRRICFDLRIDIRDDSGRPRTQAQRFALARSLRKARHELRCAVDTELALQRGA